MWWHVGWLGRIDFPHSLLKGMNVCWLAQIMIPTNYRWANACLRFPTRQWSSRCWSPPNACPGNHIHSYSMSLRIGALDTNNSVYLPYRTNNPVVEALSVRQTYIREWLNSCWLSREGPPLSLSECYCVLFSSLWKSSERHWRAAETLRGSHCVFEQFMERLKTKVLQPLPRAVSHCPSVVIHCVLIYSLHKDPCKTCSHHALSYRNTAWCSRSKNTDKRVRVETFEKTDYKTTLICF